jgi:hypothetical protein
MIVAGSSSRVSGHSGFACSIQVSVATYVNAGIKNETLTKSKCREAIFCQLSSVLDKTLAQLASLVSSLATLVRKFWYFLIVVSLVGQDGRHTYAIFSTRMSVDTMNKNNLV